MTRHIVIAAGGSGGHVLPAQAVAEELQQAGVCTSFAAFGLSTNAFFDRDQYSFDDIAAAPPAPSLRFLGRTAQGLSKAVFLFLKKRPSLVIGFGSYHSFPVLAAAALLRIPTVLYAADAVPGRVIRLFSPFAQWTGCYFKEATEKLRGKSYHVDFPLRPPFRSLPSKEEGRSYFGIDHHRPMILVLGGSQGAHFLNAAVPAAIGSLEEPPLVIHLAGHSSDIQAIGSTYRDLNIEASVRPYERSMHYAYAAADLVIGRSGASTIAEIEACGTPALYIPYPQAMDDHQRKNAHLAAARGNAVVIDEKTATHNAIADAIQCLLVASPQKCEYQQTSCTTFVSKILHTLDEVSLWQKR